MSAKSFVVVMVVLAVVGLLAYGLVSKGGDSIAVGDTAPDTRHRPPCLPRSSPRAPTHGECSATG